MARQRQTDEADALFPAVHYERTPDADRMMQNLLEGTRPTAMEEAIGHRIREVAVEEAGRYMLTSIGRTLGLSLYAEFVDELRDLTGDVIRAEADAYNDRHAQVMGKIGMNAMNEAYQFALHLTNTGAAGIDRAVKRDLRPQEEPKRPNFLQALLGQRHGS